mmetsp:Transcript_39190/g.57665  ORF Transcript_39190/g.57665 Transcript_39190/m.57665 type:complete len:401 (-) Transcript_39190:1531-2733(-)
MKMSMFPLGPMESGKQAEKASQERGTRQTPKPLLQPAQRGAFSNSLPDQKHWRHTTLPWKRLVMSPHHLQTLASIWGRGIFLPGLLESGKVEEGANQERGTRQRPKPPPLPAPRGEVNNSPASRPRRRPAGVWKGTAMKATAMTGLSAVLFSTPTTMAAAGPTRWTRTHRRSPLVLTMTTSSPVMMMMPPTSPLPCKWKWKSTWSSAGRPSLPMPRPRPQTTMLRPSSASAQWPASSPRRTGRCISPSLTLSAPLRPQWTRPPPKTLHARPRPWTPTTRRRSTRPRCRADLLPSRTLTSSSTTAPSTTTPDKRGTSRRCCWRASYFPAERPTSAEPGTAPTRPGSSPLRRTARTWASTRAMPVLVSARSTSTWPIRPPAQRSSWCRPCAPFRCPRDENAD